MFDIASPSRLVASRRSLTMHFCANADRLRQLCVNTRFVATSSVWMFQTLPQSQTWWSFLPLALKILPHQQFWIHVPTGTFISSRCYLYYVHFEAICLAKTTCRILQSPFWGIGSIARENINWQTNQCRCYKRGKPNWKAKRNVNQMSNFWLKVLCHL